MGLHKLFTLALALIATSPAFASGPSTFKLPATTFTGQITGNLTGAVTGNASTATTAATATALAADPADCSAGQYATTIAASGALTCAAVTYGQVSGTPTAASSVPFTASTPILRDANGDTLDRDPSYVIDFIEEFLGYQSASNGNWVFNGACVGAGCQVIPAGGGTNVDINHIGTAPMSTGTTTTGAASMFSGTTILGGGGQLELEWLMNLSALSDATNTYTMTMGLCDSFSNSVTDCSAAGAWLRYTHATNSGNFQLKTASGSTTTNNTSTAPSTGWHKFKVVQNAGGTLVTAYMDGVSIGTSTTNIAKTLAVPMLMGFYITKSAGTTAVKMNLDYVKLRWKPTTPR